MRKRRFFRRPADEASEFLWLVSLSDLMMLLFIFFVMLFSIAYTKMKKLDFQRVVQSIRHEKITPTPMDEVRSQMEKWAKQLPVDKVSVKKTPDAILLEIKDRVFFASGKYELHEEGKNLLRSLVPILQTIPHSLKIGIEGHTDDVPVNSQRVRDNWDLSARRAVSVLESLDLPEPLQSRVVILAHADKDPLLPNRTPAGEAIPGNQAQNRRVTFRVF